MSKGLCATSLNIEGLQSNHQGDVAQALFHHPAEVVIQEAEDTEYIVRALVIGHEDV